MKLKRLLLAALVVLALPSILIADERTPTLDNFWKEWSKQSTQWDKQKSTDLNSPEVQRFIQRYGRQWSPVVIPLMIHDVQSCKQEEAELHDFVYCYAIAYIPDRQGCKVILAKIHDSPAAHDEKDGLSDTKGDIAYDFQEAIKAAEKKSASK